MFISLVTDVAPCGARGHLVNTNTAHHTSQDVFLYCQLLTRKLSWGQETPAWANKILPQSRPVDQMTTHNTREMEARISLWITNFPKLYFLSVNGFSNGGQILWDSRTPFCPPNKWSPSPLCLGLLKYFSSNLINWKSPSDFCHDTRVSLAVLGRLLGVNIKSKLCQNKFGRSVSKAWLISD